MQGARGADHSFEPPVTAGHFIEPAAPIRVGLWRGQVVHHPLAPVGVVFFALSVPFVLFALFAPFVRQKSICIFSRA